MAKRDLIISFLSSVPNGIKAKFKNAPLTVTCPVSQWDCCKPNMQCPPGRQPCTPANEKYPGGRPGYQIWLQEHAQPSSITPGKMDVIPGLFQSAGAQPGDTIGKVAVIGFSNGCIGVDETLGYADAFQIDSVIACDGIHGQWADPVKKTMNIGMYKNFFNFGVHVLGHDAENDPAAPSMTVTHSSIIPGSYPSTTDTAYYIWGMVEGRAKQEFGEQNIKCGTKCYERILRLLDKQVSFGPCSYMGYTSFWNLFSDSWYERLSYGNFNVWGWGDIKDGKIVTRDPTGHCDHIFQGQAVLNALMEEMLVNRWNAICGVAGLGVTPQQVQMCTPAQGCEYGEGKEKQDFFPELPAGGGGASTVPAPQCPIPPPGYVIVPVEGNSCNMEKIKVPGAVMLESPKILTAENIFSFVSGAALGYLGYRYANKRFR